MGLEYGAAANFTAEFAGPFAALIGSTAKLAMVTLPAAGWKGANSPYSQAVTVEGISTNSKVDLTADSGQMEKLMATILYIENDNGSATAWAVGQKPTEDMVLQAYITEVATA